MLTFISTEVSHMAPVTGDVRETSNAVDNREAKSVTSSNT